MARRRDQEDSSLELLLDTICNVFGGIVFIAILVSILTSAESSEVEATAQDASKHLEVEREVQDLRAQEQRLQSAIDEASRTMKLLDADGRQQEFAVAVDALEQRLLEATGRMEANRKWLEEYREWQKSLATSSVEVQQKLKAQAAALEREIAQSKDQRTIDARLHAERETTKTQVILLLEGDCVYVVPVGRGKNAIINSELDDQVSCDGSVLTGLTIRPKPGKGIKPSEVDGSPQLMRLIAALPPQTHYIEMFVMPDSVNAYTEMRDLLAQRGYQYAISPCDEPPLQLGARSGPSIVQ
jgi:hypothetical protein